MLGGTLLALRDHARVRAIGSVIARYGIGDVMHRLGLSELLPGNKTPVATEMPERSAPERLRRALEELGPTFIKLGQILATRNDLLPLEWTQELEKLQGHAAPVPWETIRPELELALGQTVDQAFARFDIQVLASASMAQVYRACLRDGTEVVVKVQRPGLESLIQADLRLLKQIARLVQQQGLLPEYRPYDIVRALAEAIADELDFTREAANTVAVRENMQPFKDIVVPRVYMEWTSATVMVQEFVPGVSPIQEAQLQAIEVDRPLLARRGALAFLHMVLEDGLFHADPHPGNMMALPGNQVAFIDFGLVGHLTERRRQQLLVLLRAIVDGQADGVATTLLDWSGAEDFDWSRLEESAQRYVARQSSGLLSISVALLDFMALARENHLILPPDLALLFKAFITADGVLKRLDPQFDVVEVAQPVILALMRKQYSPRRVYADLQRSLLESRQLAMDAPQLLRLLMHRVRQGKISARIQVEGMPRLASSLEKAATRLAIAIVTAAFVLILGPVLVTRGPAWLGLTIFSWAGLLAAVLGLVLVLWGFWRRR
ncbi:MULTISPECIES: ABC1 kinase family protein [Alcaligenes]|jgi:ubiquinone biosynthesis protein|uniref:ABC transporter n=2 Tax=Alcaligenes TaxID=507 RepID=A0AB33CVA1_ALCFA|nr:MULTISPECIES: AarF/UbiB family protein [Alcaligenes]ASR90206.1 ABC transporter [Alcaligenes faecalis]AWG34968.1 ABC transporter [Alcaligenes aquatilis]MCC9162089.1 AarF/UbiB family protein [Alcaligenes sp. MMA]QXR34746.1 ABC transporter [Alcaligenes aquatilis]UQN34918.1 AarF/UbiB family protein [Alcaligenes aquatilis]